MVIMTACSAPGLVHALPLSGGIDVLEPEQYGPGPRRSLDIYRPNNASKAPVVVFFYGGSWQSGNKASYAFVGRALARRGYIVIIPDYRVYPK